MRAPWHLRISSTRLFGSATPAIVLRSDQTARELDDLAAAKLDRGYTRSHPELLHTFLHVGDRPIKRG